MVIGKLSLFYSVLLICVTGVTMRAQSPPPKNPKAQGGGSFMVQCPTSTVWHPGSSALGYDPTRQEGQYTGPSTVSVTVDSVPLAYTLSGGAIKCQEISGGDGYMTEADGNQTFMFSFGPLSGMDLIKHGQPGTQLAADFNNYYNSPFLPSACANDAPSTCQSAGPASNSADPTFDPSRPISLNGAVADPAQIMTIGVMNGNLPMPLAAFDEDDEFFLTLSNVGMIMRPDLFEEHTVHFHGYPNASSYYDGVPDASVAINIGASFTYYYLAPDAGTYFWHCHITPPEHLQMGMVGQLFVRPRQDRVPSGGDLYTFLGYQNGVSEPTTNPVADLRTACNPAADILCSAFTPAVNSGATRAVAGSLCNSPTANVGSGLTPGYVYNDGDGSTCYDTEYPIQMHGFDPNFHFVGMTFNPEMFVDMKDKYFLLNGRSYPDTVAAGPQATVSTDGQMHYSQPLPAIINIPAGGKAALRLVNLSVSEYHTLQTLGIPMHVVGFNAKLLRDQVGMNTEFYTNSITLGGGESLDVILDTSVGKPDGTKYQAGETYY